MSAIFRKRILTDRCYSYKRTYMPASYHIAQEIQKYNIPDYRPRQEQYVLFLPWRLLCLVQSGY